VVRQFNHHHQRIITIRNATDPFSGGPTSMSVSGRPFGQSPWQSPRAGRCGAHQATARRGAFLPRFLGRRVLARPRAWLCAPPLTPVATSPSWRPACFTRVAPCILRRLTAPQCSRTRQCVAGAAAPRRDLSSAGATEEGVAAVAFAGPASGVAPAGDTPAGDTPVTASPASSSPPPPPPPSAASSAASSARPEKSCTPPGARQVPRSRTTPGPPASARSTPTSRRTFHSGVALST